MAAIGTTDAQGEFSALTTHDPDDGICAGQYTVTLSPATEASNAPVNDVAAYSAAAPTNVPFPTKYLNTVESDIKVTIGEDSEKELTLTLTD